MASETNRRSDLVRQSILDHSTTLFDRAGYAETRLQDIADSMGLSRPSIYYYFKSKEDILVALLWDMINVEWVLEPVSDDTLSPLERLRALMLRIGTQVAERPARIRIINRNSAQVPRMVMKEFTQARRKVRDALTEAVEAAIASGDVKPIEAKLNTSIIFGALAGLPDWYPHSESFGMDVMEGVVEMLLHGIVEPASEKREATFENVAARIHQDLEYLERTHAATTATKSPASAKRKKQ